MVRGVRGVSVVRGVRWVRYAHCERLHCLKQIRRNTANVSAQNYNFSVKFTDNSVYSRYIIILYILFVNPKNPYRSFLHINTILAEKKRPKKSWKKFRDFFEKESDKNIEKCKFLS